ncbi:hypothetical protein B296_00000840, partial [Ensete ventricosum]
MVRKDAVTVFHCVWFIRPLPSPPFPSLSVSDAPLALSSMESYALPRPIASSLPAHPTALLRHRHLCAFRLFPLHSSSPISYPRRPLS